jgi:hypothetical protein
MQLPNTTTQHFAIPYNHKQQHGESENCWGERDETMLLITLKYIEIWLDHYIHFLYYLTLYEFCINELGRVR